MPTRRGRNQLDAASGTIPRRAKTKPILAVSAARRMSMARVMVMPMPTAGPLMAAITGLVHWKMRRVRRPPSSRCAATSRGGLASPDGEAAAAWAASSKVLAPIDRSAPAQKARPRPVTMTARTSSSASARSNASSSSRNICGVNAFILSGRSRVMVRIGPSTS